MKLSVVTSFFVVRQLQGALNVASLLKSSSSSSSSSAAISLPTTSSATQQRVLEIMTSSPSWPSLSSSASSSSSSSSSPVEAAAHRQLEYLYCLAMNLASPVVGRVVLLVEDDPSAELLSRVLHLSSSSPSQSSSTTNSVFHHFRHKLVPVTLWRQQQQQRRQPFYSDLFRVAARLWCPRSPASFGAGADAHHHVVAVCNSDVHFNTLQMRRADFLRAVRRQQHKEAEGNDGDGVGGTVAALALTRYEEDGERDSFLGHGGNKKKRPQHHDGAAGDEARLLVSSSRDYFAPIDARASPLLADYRGSHDAFLFQPSSSSFSCHPLASPDFFDSVSHPQNAYQAENVVIYEMQRRGVRVLNPSRGDFRIAHRHESEVRQWFRSPSSLSSFSLSAENQEAQPLRYGLAPPSD